MDIRLEGMNEFRMQLKDQTQTFARNAELNSCTEDVKTLHIAIEHMRGDLQTLESNFNVANVGLEKRLEAMNEFRDQLKDQAGTFFTKNEHEQFAKRVDDEIGSLKESRAEAKGKASQNQVLVATLIGVIGIIVGLVGLTLRVIGM
jgi:chromosome segregation ATPase